MLHLFKNHARLQIHFLDVSGAHVLIWKMEGRLYTSKRLALDCTDRSGKRVIRTAPSVPPSARQRSSLTSALKGFTIYSRSRLIRIHPRCVSASISPAP
eukprot:6176654-Pleurochrysis_carterae.AAC.2